jgi:hypothetical protein
MQKLFCASSLSGKIQGLFSVLLLPTLAIIADAISYLLIKNARIPPENAAATFFIVGIVALVCMGGLTAWTIVWFTRLGLAVNILIVWMIMGISGLFIGVLVNSVTNLISPEGPNIIVSTVWLINLHLLMIVCGFSAVMGAVFSVRFWLDE